MLQPLLCLKVEETNKSKVITTKENLFLSCVFLYFTSCQQSLFLFIYLVNDRFLDIQYQYVFKSTSLRKRTFAWTKSFSHIHVANLKSTVNLISMYLNCGRKLWKEPMQMWVQPHLHGFQSQGSLAVRRWFSNWVCCNCSNRVRWC